MVKDFSDNFFEQELAEKAGELKRQRREKLKYGVQFTLQDIVDKIQPHTKEITNLMIGKIQKNKLLHLVSSIIEKDADGRIRVPALSESSDKTSPIWVYVGTHWEEVPHVQIFFDFIRDACGKMELSEELIDDVSFFAKLKKQVELKLSRHSEPKENENVVLVNFINGTLEIHRDGRRNFRQHSRKDYFRYVLPYPYDPYATCPRFQQFLDEVLPDQSVHTTILEYVGSCLIPWFHVEAVMAFLGNGSNGKSVLIGVIEKLFGKTCVAHENIADLTHDEVHRANIEGKLINVSTENEGRINSSAFKTLASGEPISCKKLYSQPYSMARYAKLLFAFNEMPNIRAGYANMRRWLVIKFDVCISEEQADTELGEKLALELPGIMNLVLNSLPDLLKRKKFSKSDTIKQAVQELEVRNNPVLQFIEDRCEVNSSALTKGSELYKDFCEYCSQNNYKELTNREFYRRLEEKYPFKQHNNQKAFNIRVIRYED